MRLPGSRTRSVWALALFVAIQLADGIMTALGVSQFGAAIEGNPLLRFIAGGAGIGATLVGAKLLAISCATVLHLHSRHLALAVLTLAYVLAAIVPWTLLLASS